MAKRKPQTVATIPPLLQQSVPEKIAELKRRELDFGWEITHPYEEYLLSWRERIERFFLSSFVISLRPDKVQHWDLVTAQQHGFGTMRDEMLDELSDITEELVEPAEEKERDAFLLGALFGRWQLALGGTEDPDIPWPLYAGAAIAGMGFADRARGWTGVYRQKVGEMFAAQQAQQGTLFDTMAQFDALITGFTRRMGQLARNQWYFAAVTGERAAVRPFRVGELWLIQDERACPICKALHLTVTTKIPIKDSHPSCRCIKVPLATNFTPTPVSFAAFADRHAYRPS
jgi:hypothetical protein